MNAKQTPLVDLLRLHAEDLHSDYGHNKSARLLSQAADEIDRLRSNALALEDDSSAGLTKRELFAAMAMQGLCANPSRVGKFDGYAVDALRLADALLAALVTPSEEPK